MKFEQARQDGECHHIIIIGKKQRLCKVEANMERFALESIGLYVFDVVVLAYTNTCPAGHLLFLTDFL